MATTPLTRASQSGLGVTPYGVSREDVVAGVVVNLEVDRTGTTYQYTLLSKPPGSVSTIINPTSASATIIPDGPGTYRWSCAVDGVSTHAIDATTRKLAPVGNQGAFRVLTPEGFGPPAAEETTEFGPEGWHPTLYNIVRSMPTAIVADEGEDIASQYEDKVGFLCKNGGVGRVIQFPHKPLTMSRGVTHDQVFRIVGQGPTKITYTGDLTTENLFDYNRCQQSGLRDVFITVDTGKVLGAAIRSYASDIALTGSDVISGQLPSRNCFERVEIQAGGRMTDGILIILDPTTYTIVPDHTTDSFTYTAHPWVTGDGPYRFSSDSIPPAAFALNTNYWIIKLTANTFQLASSSANAIAETEVTFSDNGTGTIKLSGQERGKNDHNRFIDCQVQGYTNDGWVWMGDQCLYGIMRGCVTQARDTGQRGIVNSRAHTDGSYQPGHFLFQGGVVMENQVSDLHLTRHTGYLLDIDGLYSEGSVRLLDMLTSTQDTGSIYRSPIRVRAHWHTGTFGAAAADGEIVRAYTNQLELELNLGKQIGDVNMRCRVESSDPVNSEFIFKGEVSMADKTQFFVSDLPTNINMVGENPGIRHTSTTNYRHLIAASDGTTVRQRPYTDALETKLLGVVSDEVWDFGATELITTTAVNTVNAATDDLTCTAHTFRAGYGPIKLSTTVTIPGGLSTTTAYWIGFKDANTISLHTTRADGLAGTNDVAISDAGSGVLTITSTTNSTGIVKGHKRRWPLTPHGFPLYRQDRTSHDLQRAGLVDDAIDCTFSLEDTVTLNPQITSMAMAVWHNEWVVSRNLNRFISLGVASTGAAGGPNVVGLSASGFMRNNINNVNVDGTYDYRTAGEYLTLAMLRNISLVIEGVSTTTEALTRSGHRLRNGYGPLRLTNSGGALPTGLAAGTDYWIIRLNNDEFKLAATRDDALNGVAVNITAVGSGTHTLAGVIFTVRTDKELLTQATLYGDPTTLYGNGTRKGIGVASNAGNTHCVGVGIAQARLFVGEDKCSKIDDLGREFHRILGWP